MSLGCRGHRAWPRRHISNHGCCRRRSRDPIHRSRHPAECGLVHRPRCRRMLLGRYRVPKTVPHVASDHMNDSGWGNQSCDRSIRRCPVVALTGIGTSELLLLNAHCITRSVAATIRPRMGLSELMRSVHWRPTRRWKLRRSVALIGSTSLTNSGVISITYRYPSHFCESRWFAVSELAQLSHVAPSRLPPILELSRKGLAK